MVKNTTGGTGAKSLGRKHQTSGTDRRLRLSENEFEKYACVTKILGNGMCEIHTFDNMKLMGHIRKKMKGKHKRNNLVSSLSIVLVGLRDFENPPKNCDIMVIYDDIQIEQIRQIPSINIENIVEMRISQGDKYSSSATAVSNIEFTMDAGDDEPHTKIGGIAPQFDEFKTDEMEIDIDDI
jgi:initiation factor 1A